MFEIQFSYVPHLSLSESMMSGFSSFTLFLALHMKSHSGFKELSILKVDGLFPANGIFDAFYFDLSHFLASLEVKGRGWKLLLLRELSKSSMFSILCYGNILTK